MNQGIIEVYEDNFIPNTEKDFTNELAVYFPIHYDIRILV